MGNRRRQARSNTVVRRAGASISRRPGRAMTTSGEAKPGAYADDSTGPTPPAPIPSGSQPEPVPSPSRALPTPSLGPTSQAPPADAHEGVGHPRTASRTSHRPRHANPLPGRPRSSHRVHSSPANHRRRNPRPTRACRVRRRSHHRARPRREASPTSRPPGRSSQPPRASSCRHPSWRPPRHRSIAMSDRSAVPCSMHPVGRPREALTGALGPCEPKRGGARRGENPRQCRRLVHSAGSAGREVWSAAPGRSPGRSPWPGPSSPRSDSRPV